MYKSTKEKPEKKNTKNIKEYSDYVVLKSFSKKHSPNSVIIVEDNDDSWFHLVLTYRTKTGVITDTSIIIKPDLEVWIRHVQRMGYEFKK